LLEHYRESYSDVLGKRVVLFVLAAAVLSAAVWNGAVTYAGAFFESRLAPSGVGLAALFLGLGMAYVAGGGLATVGARRVQPRTIAVWSTAAAVVLPVAIVSSTGIVALCIASTLAFAGTRAPGIAALNNILFDLVSGAPGTAVSVYGVVAASGAIIGAALGGVAISLQGYLGMGTLFSGLALASLVFLVVPWTGRTEAVLEPAD